MTDLDDIPVRPLVMISAASRSSLRKTRCRSQPSASPRSLINMALKVGRHRVARSSGCDSHRAHRQPDRSLQDPRQGQPFPSRPPQDGVAAANAPRLCQEAGREPIQDSHRAPGYPPLKASSTQMERLIPGAPTQRRATARPTPFSQCESLASWQDRKRLAFVQPLAILPMTSSIDGRHGPQAFASSTHAG